MALDPSHVGVDVREGLPSVTVIGAPDRYSMRLADALRARRVLILARITVTLHPRSRRTLPDIEQLADVVVDRLAER